MAQWRVRHLTSPKESSYIGDVLCGAVNKSEIYGFLKQTREAHRVDCKACLKLLRPQPILCDNCQRDIAGIGGPFCESPAVHLGRFTAQS